MFLNSDQRGNTCIQKLQFNCPQACLQSVDFIYLQFGYSFCCPCITLGAILYCAFCCCCCFSSTSEESELENELPKPNLNESVVNMEPPNPEFLRLEHINGVPRYPAVGPGLQPYQLPNLGLNWSHLWFYQILYKSQSEYSICFQNCQ